MADDLISCGIVAAAFAMLTLSFQGRALFAGSNVARFVGVCGFASLAWLLLTIRELGPLSITNAGWRGVAIGVTVAAATAVGIGTRRGFIVAAFVCLSAVGPILIEMWRPVAAAALIVGLLAVLAHSAASKTLVARTAATQDTPARRIAGVLTGAVAAVAIQSIFLKLVDSLGTEPREVTVAVGLATAGGVLVGAAILIEVIFGEGSRTGPMVVVAAALLACVAGAEAVIPAGAMSAAVFLGPLVTAVDTKRDELADDFANEPDGAPVVIEREEPSE